MTLIHNEQAKLTATYINGLAIATFALGALAPTAAVGLVCFSSVLAYIKWREARSRISKDDRFFSSPDGTRRRVIAWLVCLLDGAPRRAALALI